MADESADKVRGGLEFKQHTPAAGYSGTRNEKWVVHRQIIVIVF